MLVGLALDVVFASGIVYFFGGYEESYYYNGWNLNRFVVLAGLIVLVTWVARFCFGLLHLAKYWIRYYLFQRKSAPLIIADTLKKCKVPAPDRFYYDMPEYFLQKARDFEFDCRETMPKTECERILAYGCYRAVSSEIDAYKVTGPLTHGISLATGCKTALKLLNSSDKKLGQ